MLKILAFNINGVGTKHGPWSQRRELIRRVIQDSQPDLIALEAVRKEPGVDGGNDQAAQLAAILPEYSHVVFCPAHRDPSGIVDGSAWMAKIPILAPRAISLTRRPGLGDPFDRILLYGRLELATGPLHLINAHFSWVAKQARDNVEETLRLADSIPGPRILVGDLNNTPESEPMRRLAQAGWIDAWAQVHPDQPGCTFESGDLTRRIDYVWISDPSKLPIEAIETVGDLTAENCRPSDHLGLSVSLQVVAGE